MFRHAMAIFREVINKKIIIILKLSICTCFISVLFVVFFLLGDYKAPEFYMPTFRNTLFHLRKFTPPMKTEQSVPKRRHIKFRRRGITRKKEYNIQNTAKV